MNFRNDISTIVESLARVNFGVYDEGKDYYAFDNHDADEVRYLATILSDDFESDVDCFYGASKAVFDIPERDYVVKIPFNGGYYPYISDDDDDDESYDNDCENKFYMFVYANRDSGEGSTWDYCEQEEIIYNKAVSLDIGDMFAGTVKITNVYSYPIYASEKAEPYSQVDYGTSSTNETVRHIFANVKPYYPEDSELYKIGKQFLKECEETEEFSTPDKMNLEFLGYMINYYGKEKVRTLCKFLHENELNDFHTSNIGFVGDRPVLIDYSGYFEFD